MWKHNLSLSGELFAAFRLQHSNNAIFTVTGAVKDYEIWTCVQMSSQDNLKQSYLSCIIGFSTKAVEHHQSLVITVPFIVWRFVLLKKFSSWDESTLLLSVLRTNCEQNISVSFIPNILFSARCTLLQFGVITQDVGRNVLSDLKIQYIEQQQNDFYSS